MLRRKPTQKGIIMTTATRGSKYAAKLNISEFRSRLMKCTFDMTVHTVDAYGMVNPMHIYVQPHAGESLRDRGASNFNQLFVEWFKDAVAHAEILEDVIMASEDECDKFFVLDKNFGRVLTFSVMPSRKEYVVLIQSVYFLDAAKGEQFHVGTPDAFCYSISSSECVSGIENIPEMNMQC